MQPTKIIALTRVSTEEQAQDGRAGLGRQEASIHAMLARYPGVPCHWVTLAGVSGADVLRSREWRTQVEPHLGPTTLVMADEISRLVRMDGYDLGVLPVIHTRGSWIATPAQTYDPSDTSAHLSLTLQALFAGVERQQIARRSSKSKEVLRRKGGWVGKQSQLPTGVSYRKSKAKGEVGVWSYNDEAHKVKELYQRFAAGESIRSLASYFGWTLRRVTSILKNTIYIGIQTYDRKTDTTRPRIDDEGHRRSGPAIPRAPEEVIAVQVIAEPLVNPELFALAQARLKSNATQHRKLRLVGAVHAPFSGLLKVRQPFPAGITELRLDEANPHKLYGMTTKQEEHRYVCACTQPGSQHERCDWGQPRSSVVNAALDKLLSSATSEGWFMDAMRAALAPSEDLNSKINALQREQGKLEKARKKLLNLLVDEVIEQAEFKLKRGEIDEKLSKLTTELADLETLSSGRIPPEVALAQVRGWTWDPTWETPVKRKWLAKHLDYILVSRDGVEGLSLSVGGTLPTLLSWPPVTWESLLGYGLRDRSARWKASGALTDAQMAELVGSTEGAIRKARQRGKIAPTGQGVGAYAPWSPADVEEVRAAMATDLRGVNVATKAKGQGLWGITEMCAHYGVGRTTVLRWLKQGKVPEPAKTLKNGTRLWEPLGDR